MQAGEPQTWTCCSKAVCTAQPEAQNSNQGADDLAPAEVHVYDQSGMCIDMRYTAADVHHHVTRAAGKLKSTFAKQESHCSPVHQLLFNAVDPRCSNLVASVGGNQVSMTVPSACAYTTQGCNHRRRACVEASAPVNTQQRLHMDKRRACACLAHQATVYDNQHLGSHIGVTVHFANEATGHSHGGVHSLSLCKLSMLLGVQRSWLSGHAAI